MTNPLDLNARDYTEFFSRHLIGLCWYEGPVNSDGEFAEEPKCGHASGFLLQVQDRYCLVTAGHVLKEMKERCEADWYSAKHHSLFDVWSPRSTVKEAIPFNFADAPAIVTDNTSLGVDIAVIELPSFYLEMFSQTIEPFTHERWVYQANVQFDFFAIVGIPYVASEKETSHTSKGFSVTTYPQPQVILLEASSPITPEDENSLMPQFFGRILPGHPIQQLAGVSGGPILGFRKEPDGQLRYWPVAVQSRWRRGSRTVTGTSLPAYASALHQWLAEDDDS